MTTLWTYGDSYTDFYDLDLMDNVYNAYEHYRQFRGETLPKIWPVLLSEKLNYNLVNRARGASPNSFIFSKFIQDIGQFKKGDMVIIGWASVLRFRIYNEDQLSPNFFHIWPNLKTTVPNISQNTLDEITFNRRGIPYIHEVEEWKVIIDKLCDLIGIDVYHFSSEKMLFDGEYKNVIKKDDFHLIHYVSSIEGCTISSETGNIVKDEHHGEKGHKLMCEIIHNYHKNNVGI